MAASDFGLTNGKLVFDSSGDCPIVTGADYVVQNSAFRLNLLLGEIFDDTRQGVPWITDMVSPDVSIAAKKQILKNIILQTEGAIQVTEMSFIVDSDGIATVKWSGICSDGSEILVSTEPDVVTSELQIDVSRLLAAVGSWETSWINYSVSI